MELGKSIKTIFDYNLSLNKLNINEHTKLIKIMVMVSLLVFLGISGYVFYLCLNDIKTPNENINLLNNMLNRLVGGVFGLALDCRHLR